MAYIKASWKHIKDLKSFHNNEISSEYKQSDVVIASTLRKLALSLVVAMGNLNCKTKWRLARPRHPVGTWTLSTLK